MPLSIAVVDDDASVRKALQRVLRSVGLQVETFASGVEFLISIETHRPDCLVLDLHLPRVTGLDVLTRLARDGVRIPTVVITGHDDPGLSEQVLAAGAGAYLAKPLDDQALLFAISSVAQKRNGDRGF